MLLRWAFLFLVFWIQVHVRGKSLSVLLDLVPCSCRQLCGRGLCEKCAPRTSTDNETFPSVANLRLVRESTTVVCYKKRWRWEWAASKDSPIFKSHQYQGVRENPQVFQSVLQLLSRGKDEFFFWGTAMMISLMQEITSRAC